MDVNGKMSLSKGSKFQSIAGFEEVFSLYRQENNLILKKVHAKKLRNYFANGKAVDLVRAGYKKELEYKEIPYHCKMMSSRYILFRGRAQNGHFFFDRSIIFRCFFLSLSE